MANAKRLDPVAAYAEATRQSPDDCRLVQLACERHLRDMARQRTPDFPYYFDADDAADRIAFFRLCRHTKGEWAGQPVTLEPWQQFCVGSVFGWKRVSDVRLLAVPRVPPAGARPDLQRRDVVRVYRLR